MINYTCDECGQNIGGGEPSIKLEGIVGTSGGILLPERFHKKHFCNTICFWEWIDKYNPSKIKRGNDDSL